ncbi:MAG TPA: hypothetical protein VHB98_19475 [Chloroflexota bacterium]|jgi:hypothetical protein|nr:hypothetical protein [Chloroflexota bacterium]
MRTPYYPLGGVAALSALLGLAGPALPAHAAAAKAPCAATGAYTIVQNGSRYAASALAVGGFPLVYGGTATLQHYSGCGASTVLQITSQGPGTLLSQPVLPTLGYQLRGAGDLLLRFVGTAKQDPQALQDPQAVRLSGTATYVRVTTTGTWHGKRRLDYKTETVTVKNVMARLKVTADLGGAFSLSCALPGPAIQKYQSSFAYFAVGAHTPARLASAKKPDPNL